MFSQFSEPRPLPRERRPVRGDPGPEAPTGPTVAERVGPRDALVAEGGLDEEPGVEAGDDEGGGPGEELQGAAVDEFAHEAALSGEDHERHDGEAELKRENDLAEDEELLGSLLAVDGDDDDGGDDGQTAGDEAAQPRGDLEVNEAFHDDLAGEGSCNGRVLAGGEQSDGEQRAGEGCADQGAEELIGVFDGGDLEVAAAMEDGGGNDEDAGVNEQSDGEGEGRIDVGKVDCFAFARGRALVVTALDNR